MIPVSYGILILSMVLIIGSFGGGLAGALASLLLRLRWDARVLLIDMALAAVAMVLTVVSVALYNFKHGTLYGGLGALIVVGLSVPSLRALLQLAIRRH